MYPVPRIFSVLFAPTSADRPGLCLRLWPLFRVAARRGGSGGGGGSRGLARVIDRPCFQMRLFLHEVVGYWSATSTRANTLEQPRADPPHRPTQPTPTTAAAATLSATLAPLPPQSQYLIVPSHEHVATQEGSIGCQIAWMHTWSWHLSLRKTLPDFQSQNQSLPSPSPDIT